MKAVRFDTYGGLNELYLAEGSVPQPSDTGVVVRVRAAAINPGEVAIRSGALDAVYPATFPSGEGTDFAGIITAVGSSVTNFKVGDAVAGYTHDRASHAEYVAVEADQVTPKPENVPWEIAGSLWVAGMTANAATKAVGLKAGDTVVIAGAAGGVGSIAVQYALLMGANVYAIAGKHDQEWLESKGAHFISYDGTVESDLRSKLGTPDAFLDFSGKGYVKMAVDLGVARNRINTIIDFAAAERYGVHADGGSVITDVHELTELLRLISEGDIEVPIAKTFPLDDVREAFAFLESGHHRGKVVLVM